MSIQETSRIGEIAAEHPLATKVFARHGIDFCCGGGKPLEEVCEKKGLDTQAIMKEIEGELAEGLEDSTRWDQTPLEELIDHILTAYHGPLREELPRLNEMAEKVNRVHGRGAPNLLPDLVSTLQGLSVELESHMVKEEEILFPMIKEGLGPDALGPISVMESEHAAAGDVLARLRAITNDYEVPEGACNTWKALWAGLSDLEAALHRHIHLENNILFPRALAN